MLAESKFGMLRRGRVRIRTRLLSRIGLDWVYEIPLPVFSLYIFIIPIAFAYITDEDGR